MLLLLLLLPVQLLLLLLPVLLLLLLLRRCACAAAPVRLPVCQALLRGGPAPRGALSAARRGPAARPAARKQARHCQAP